MDVKSYGAALIDLVLPAECAGCAAPPTVGAWCARCVDLLGGPSWPHLPGGPVVLATGRYTGPLRTALLRYKERGRRDLAVPLAHRLRPAVDEVVAELTVATGSEVWLVPAPSRPAAARARGGDHVLRLARALARQQPAVRVAPALALARRTRDSVGLDAAERVANLAGSLRVRRAALPDPGAAVLLLDDVVTTGATLRACRTTLAAAGFAVDAAVVLCDATSARDDHGTSATW